jgi:hypothetical protein
MSDTQLAVDVAVLKKEMEMLTRNLAEMNKTLETISGQLSEAKGGWRIMLLIGGSFASVAALIAAWAGFFTGKH